MSPEELKLVQLLAATPRCLDTRLVYADMLEERGDPACDYLRRECQWFERIADSPLSDEPDVHDIIADLQRLSLQLSEVLLSTVAWRCTAVMLHWNDRKLAMVKLARDYTRGSLLETKTLVESSPCVIKRMLIMPEAHEIYTAIRHWGGSAVLVPTPLTPPLPNLGTVREKLTLRAGRFH